MKTQSVRGTDGGKKSIRYLLLAAIGVILLGLVAIPMSGAMVHERVLCDRSDQGNRPCNGMTTATAGKESDYMAPTKSPDVYDPTVQPIATETAVITRPATFALG